MRTEMQRLTTCFILMLAFAAPVFGQAGPPAAASLEDVSGCSLEGESVFVVTGRDAAAKRYKYPWDASIDALCNAKGYAISAPPKGVAPSPIVPRPPPAPAVTAAVPSASGAPMDFPADAVPLSAEAVSKKVSGTTFDTQLYDGTRVRLEYKANGYLFLNAPGFANSGPWRAEDSRICSQMKNAAASCNEVREQGKRLYVKRDNGEVIALNPR
jgi:hypothetical protein